MKRIAAILLTVMLFFTNGVYAWIDYDIVSKQTVKTKDMRLIETYNGYIFTADTNSVYVYSKDNVDKQMMSFGSSSAVKSMFVFEDYLIIGYSDSIIVYDAASVISADFEIVREFYIKTEKLFLCGKYLAAASNNSVYLYELSDLRDETKEMFAVENLTATNFFADRGYIFSVNDAEVSVYDLEAAAETGNADGAYISSFSRPAYGDGAYLNIADIAVSNGYAYISTNTSTVATYDNGVFCYEISTGNYVSMYSPRQDKLGTRATEMEAVNNILIVSCQDCVDIKLLDISKQENIQVLTNIKVKESPYGYNFKYENNTLYVCSRTNGIEIVDLMPAYISELGIYNNGVRSGKIRTGEEYNARVSVENYENRAVNGILLLAVFEDNYFQEAITTDVIVPVGTGKAEFNTESIAVRDGQTLKAYFFDSLYGLIPYKNPTEVNAVNSELVYDFYVDGENGNDNNKGDESNPFKTIGRAKEEVRKYNRFADKDINVWIASGEYAVSEPIIFAERDSGFNGHKVIYRAYGEASPIIHGGTDVENWKLYDAEKNIYRAYEPSATNRQLFADGKRAVRARSKGDVDGFANDGGASGFLCKNTEFLDYSKFENVEFIFSRNWVSRRSHPIGVTDNGDGTVFVAVDKWNEINDKDYKMPQRVTYYENAYELLDEPGEFYVDGGYVYFIPFDGVNPNESKVVSPLCEELINIKGENPLSHTQNLIFDGLTFKYTTWLKPNENQFIDTQNLYPEKPAAAVNIENADSIELINCELSNMGADGISVRRTAKNISIIGNHFYDFSSRAIGIGDWEGSHYTNDNTEIAENVVIENNSIHDVGREYYGSPAISGVWVKNVSVLHNEIYNTPYSGIHFGWGWKYYPHTNLENINISYNYIHDFMQTMGDGGAIYFLGRTNCDEKNMNTVSYNYLKDGCGGKVIYCDEGSEFYHVFGNVIDNSEFDKNGWYIGIDGELSCAENNYSSTSNSVGSGIISEIICENGNFPEEARRIIRNAGIETEYSHLVNNKYSYFDEEYDIIEATDKKGVMLDIDGRVFVQDEVSRLSEYNIESKTLGGAVIQVDGTIKQAVTNDGQTIIYSENDSNGILTLFNSDYDMVNVIRINKNQNICIYDNVLYVIGQDGLKLYSISASAVAEMRTFADIKGNGVKVYDEGVFVENGGALSCYTLNISGKNNIVIEGEDINIAGSSVSLWINDKSSGEPVYVKKINADKNGAYRFETNIDDDIECIVKMNIAGICYETELIASEDVKNDNIKIQREDGKYLFEISGQARTDVAVMVASGDRTSIYYVNKISPDENGNYYHTFRTSDKLSVDTEVIINEDSVVKKQKLIHLLDRALPFNITITNAGASNIAQLNGTVKLYEYGIKSFDAAENQLKIYTKYIYGKNNLNTVCFDLNTIVDGKYLTHKGDFDYSAITDKMNVHTSDKQYAQSKNYYFKRNGTLVDIYDKKTDSVVGNIKRQIRTTGKYYTPSSMTVQNEKLFVYYAQTSEYGNQTVCVYDVSEIKGECEAEAGLGVNTNVGEVFSNSEYVFVSSGYYDNIRIFKYDPESKTLSEVGIIPANGEEQYADDDFVYIHTDKTIKIYSLENVSKGMNKSYLGFIPDTYAELISDCKSAYTGDLYEIAYNGDKYEADPLKSTVKRNGEIIQKTYGINEDISMLINNGYLFVWENGQNIYVYKTDR